MSTGAPDAKSERLRLPEQVVTPRLVLRRWRHDEAPLLSAAIASSLEHLRPWMPWIKFEPLTRAERVDVIEGWTCDWEEGGDVIYGVFLDAEVVGSSGLHNRSGPGTLDIGYWVHVDHVRRGYATEVTAALTTTAFDMRGGDGIEVVHVRTDEANEASAAVPAKLGFTRSGTVHRTPESPAESGRLTDWTMTADAWATRAVG